jgi:hypothetical protein
MTVLKGNYLAPINAAAEVITHRKHIIIREEASKDVYGDRSNSEEVQAEKGQWMRGLQQVSVFSWSHSLSIRTCLNIPASPERKLNNA